MKTKTVKTAIMLGFDYENSDFETREDLEHDIMCFLGENQDRLPKKRDYAEVRCSANGQHVSYGDFQCDGHIIDFEPFGKKRKIYHSQFLYIDDNGKCYQMILWDWSRV